uniref:Putative secreted protein n=1 Tax=Panstrongylus lignarius TaxID=156445 RepID=A0A224Y2I7_9HEMI
MYFLSHRVWYLQLIIAYLDLGHIKALKFQNEIKKSTLTTQQFEVKAEMIQITPTYPKELIIILVFLIINAHATALNTCTDFNCTFSYC